MKNATHAHESWKINKNTSKKTNFSANNDCLSFCQALNQKRGTAWVPSNAPLSVGAPCLKSWHDYNL